MGSLCKNVERRIKTMTKKIVSLILSAVLAFSAVNVAASAKGIAEHSAEIIAPYYIYANNPGSTLVIKGTTATCTSSTAGTPVKSIKAEQSLEKFWGLWVWNEVAYWSKNVDTTSVFMSNYKYNLESGTYRLKTVFTLTATNGETETITVYSEEVTI